MVLFEYFQLVLLYKYKPKVTSANAPVFYTYISSIFMLCYYSGHFSELSQNSIMYLIT